MFCTQCGVEIREQDCFCPRCGHRLKPDARPPAPERLMRDMRNKKIAGVCAGIGRYLNADPVLIRIIFLVLAFSTGIGFIAYIIAWIVMPKDTGYIQLPAPRPECSPAIPAGNR